MELLKKKILSEGIVLSDTVLKVDSFLNHQIDAQLVAEIGKEFAARFSGKNITKVLTVETSGIAPAFATALELKVPLVFARKQKSITMDSDCYAVEVYSFTKKETNPITISKKFLSPQDHILLIDDFLANGEAAMGLIKLIEQSGAAIAGLGIVIEKSFQPGALKVRATGYQVESLVRIASLTNGKVEFLNDGDFYPANQEVINHVK